MPLPHPRRLAALGLALLASACARTRPPPAPPQGRAADAADVAGAVAQAADEAPPLLQLPADVRPVRYALELELDPARDAGLRGRAEIHVVLDAPRRTVWLHGKDLRVSEASVDAGGETVAAAYTQVTAAGVARLDLARPVGPGPATLRLAWEAPWGDGRGAARFGRPADRLVATQLEAIDARRVFPGFDEPRFKTPFEVTVVAPRDLAVVSNTPEARVEEDGAVRRVRFAPTEPLPTYLLFASVGPYVLADASVPPGGVRDRTLPARIVYPRGRPGNVAFTREAASALLVELEGYFGLPFPYPKLDHVAVPGFYVGGMENAGAIAYREELLVRDPATDAPDALSASAGVLAHEMAHQWFGDLVTPAWWTDIWLNESFATWMGHRAVQRWRPALGSELDLLEGKARAFQVDALGSARAIVKPLDRVEDIEAQFDPLSYQKGGAVLAMFERWAGEEPFRDGIRRYVAARAHGTGSTDALLAALSASAGKDVATPFRTFLDQPGAPLVEAWTACGDGAPRVVLRQSRFVPRGSTASREATWQVPVCVRWSAGGREDEQCTLLAGAEGALELPGSCPDWIFPNAGAAGYYQVSLAPEDLARLRDRGLARLSAPERVALAGAVRASQRAGTLPYADALDTLAALARDPEPGVVREGMKAFRFAYERLVPDPLRPAVAARARALYRPALDRLGWTPRKDEPPRTRELRPELIAFLAEVGDDSAVRREAIRRGLAWLGVGGRRLRPEAVSPDVSGVAATQAVRGRGGAAFETAVARLAAARDPQIRERLVLALASTQDPALSAKAFALLLGGSVQPVERYVPLARALPTDGALADRVHEALVADPDAFLRGMGFLGARIPYLGAGACRAEDAERLEAALRPRLAEHPEISVGLARAAETIRICAAEREAERGPAEAYFSRPR